MFKMLPTILCLINENHHEKRSISIRVHIDRMYCFNKKSYGASDDSKTIVHVVAIQKLMWVIHPGPNLPQW